MVPNPISTRDVMPIQARWQCDLRDDSLHWSDGVYDLFGLPRGIPVTRDAIVAMYLPECRDRLARLRATAIAECGSFTFEARIRRADGAIRWMRVTADVVTENGIARYLYGTKIDVTDEMASEAEQAA
ncbi:PAS domain-containing protein [Sphingomonas sp.]|uniref:PAS domain-containing protein n=1 Tax=Sphingomonas sp. TaxID=28214 RepID=UPI00307DE135